VAVIVPIILAGGGGTRLWPRSRNEYPKQFLALISEKSLLVETLLRVTAAEGFADPVLSSGMQHRFHVAAELAQAELRSQAIVIEPCARNTAPAIAAAALIAAEANGRDAVAAILPADHFIADSAALRDALEAAAAVAQDRIVTLGIRPRRPETGYGYIEMGTPIDGRAYDVGRFVEKPDADSATKFLAAGNFLWNAGIFVSRIGLLLDELSVHAPDVFAAAEKAVAAAKRDPDFIRLDEDAFAAAPSISLDYAVMERTRRAAVLPVDLEWSDVGSWYALWEAEQKDGAGNVTYGDVLALECRDSLIHSDDGLVAAFGLENALVVQTSDATLVAPLARSAEARTVVEELKKRRRREADAHLLVRRPWGSYESLHNGARHQVKHLVLSPGAAISLQLHNHRSEHWVVVRGTARVTVDDTVLLLEPNQSAHIPLQARHRLENPGKEDLHVIEVQCGDYLGEDDIVRFEDKYKRV
jgi:mannose-1-phosphate guanylyltransferase/mannose-6-phosphate isomerase